MFPELMNYLFPNDVHVTWSLMIVLYPYITGLVAGAFIVSSLYHVFGREELRPGPLRPGRVVLLPVRGHAAAAEPPRPPRARASTSWSRPTSPRPWPGSVYLRRLLHHRGARDLVRVPRGHRALRGRQHRHRPRLLLDRRPGRVRRSEEAQALDQRSSRAGGRSASPMACLLHGYVGFLFGSLKANPWWSTPLMPVIFLFSAVVSGIAMLIVLYQVAMKLKRHGHRPRGHGLAGAVAVAVHDHVAHPRDPRDHDPGLRAHRGVAR